MKVLEVFPEEAEQEIEVNVGCGQPVRIQKVFGPLIFEDLRITAQFEGCAWIIERTVSVPDNPNDPEDESCHEEWREVARIEGQP